MNALPYLLAKVEAAERLAEAAAGVFRGQAGGLALHNAMLAYRKAGAE